MGHTREAYNGMHIINQSKIQEPIQRSLNLQPQYNMVGLTGKAG
jgi:hypothetical protein